MKNILLVMTVFGCALMPITAEGISSEIIHKETEMIKSIVKPYEKKISSNIFDATDQNITEKTNDKIQQKTNSVNDEKAEADLNKTKAEERNAGIQLNGEPDWKSIISDNIKPVKSTENFANQNPAAFKYMIISDDVVTLPFEDL